jgi:hypothetical protein
MATGGPPAAAEDGWIVLHHCLKFSCPDVIGEGLLEIQRQDHPLAVIAIREEALQACPDVALVFIRSTKRSCFPKSLLFENGSKQPLKPLVVLRRHGSSVFGSTLSMPRRSRTIAARKALLAITTRPQRLSSDERRSDCRRSVLLARRSKLRESAGLDSALS